MLYEFRSHNFILLIILILVVNGLSQNRIQSDSIGSNVSAISGIVKRKVRTESSGPQTIETGTSLAEDASQATEFNNRGAAYARSGDYENALIELRHAADLDPGSAVILINLSVVFDHLNRTEESLQAARQAVESEPNDLRARIQLCEMSLVTGRTPEAAICYSELEKLGQLDSNTMAKYALALLRTNQIEPARRYLEEVVKIDPYDIEAANALGMVEFRAKNYKEAAAIFKRASEVDPRNPEVRYNLGITQLMIGNKPAAISQYKLLSELSPDTARRLYRIIYKDKLVFVGDN